jgi:hypothetical protein
MTRFDRFEWDLLRQICFTCVYCTIILTGGAVVVGLLGAFIFGFPFSIKETVAYYIELSFVIGIVATLCQRLVDLKREIEQLKQTKGAQVRK